MHISVRGAWSCILCDFPYFSI